MSKERGIRTLNGFKKFLGEIARINVKEIAYNLERNDNFVVESEFKSVEYIVIEESICIITGRNGVLTVGIEEAADFAAELKEIADLAKFRKCAQVKGA